MELKSAIELINKGIESTGAPQVWADLGAGGGLFTQALSALLPPGSTIFAIDKNYSVDEKIKAVHAGTRILAVKKDFSAQLLDIDPCDGILMANSLHFVPDKTGFLARIKSNIKPGGRLLIVEYDTDNANQWVPWPISYKNLQKLIASTDEGLIKKLAEQPSIYQAGGIYSALITDF